MSNPDPLPKVDHDVIHFVPGFPFEVTLCGRRKRTPCQYVLYFNKARPHQGVGQRIPDASANDNHDGKIIAIPVLGGLHHD
jgi:hypothetical protein